MTDQELVADYLRVIRNANHSHTEVMREPHKVSLLATNMGDIPDELADLGLYHVLKVLEMPRLPTS